MTALFRQERENILATAYRGQNILAKAESFERSAIEALLAKTGCEGLRIYYGMDESLKVHAILVGFDSEDNDILPQDSLTGGGDDYIVENGIRCPDLCPPDSPINS
jgi:hypothetical protein